MSVANSEEILELTYTGVFVYRRNHVIVSTIVDEFAEDQRDHALVYHWMDNDWAQQLIDNSICGSCAINEGGAKIFNVGVDGKVAVRALPTGESVEVVDTTGDSPNYSETLRCVRVIDNYIYVAGMARQVYRRETSNRWIRMDQGVYVPRGQRTKAVGFLDIDGTPEDLYAVGYKGEIWYYNGKGWDQEDSPTNVALTKIFYVQPSVVYIAGLAGTLLCGCHGSWRAIRQETTNEDFWGITEFRGRIYLANYDGVYVLDGNSLHLIDFGLGRKFTTAYLHAADGVMWSAGSKDLAYTEDGVIWIEVEKP
ncbi:MAG TPA: hypothetical protein VFF47_01320 [Nitrospirota bacterium]|nr:hypothetical protein [Nitrospirota bacterium]